MSDMMEVAGFVCVAAAVFLFFGVRAFVAGVGVELLIYSYLLERAKAHARRIEEGRQAPARRLRRVG